MIVAERDGAVIGWAKAEPLRGPAPLLRRRARGDALRRPRSEARRRRPAPAGCSRRAPLRSAGAHKLVGKIFTSNEPSIAMVDGLGWSEVGVHRRHGTLDGEWKDVLVVERCSLRASRPVRRGHPRVEAREMPEGRMKRGLLAGALGVVVALIAAPGATGLDRHRHWVEHDQGRGDRQRDQPDHRQL